MQTIKQALQPDWRKLFLFAIFISLAIGGQAQAWAFSKVAPKPILFDFLRPFPIWSVWMVLLVPLALLASPLKLIGLNVLSGPAWLFWTAYTLYSYLLVCLFIAIFDRLRPPPKDAVD